MSGARRRVGVLISGRGSNMAALAEAARSDAFPAKIALVVSNVADAAGLARAAALGLPVASVPHGAYRDRAAFEDALDATLRAAGVEIVCLAGFMRVLSPTFIARWEGRILNIHPSLLPSFPGLDATAQAVAAGVRIHGATVHVATAALDAGPIVAQAAIPVAPGESAEAVSARLIAVEHRLYPHALKLFLGMGDDSMAPATALFSPAAD